MNIRIEPTPTGFAAYDEDQADADCVDGLYVSLTPTGHGETEFDALINLVDILIDMRWPA